MVAKIGRDELKAKIEGEDSFALVEVLGPQYYRHSHLPGAVNLPPGEVDEMSPSLLPDEDAEIVLYCWDAQWPTSRLAARELAAMGYMNVRDHVEGKHGSRRGYQWKAEAAEPDGRVGEREFWVLVIALSVALPGWIVSRRRQR